MTGQDVSALWYLWVVVPAPFESFVYKANFQVPLEPGAGSRRPPRFFNRRLLSGERKNKCAGSLLQENIDQDIEIQKWSGNVPVWTWFSVFPLPVIFSSIFLWRLVFDLVTTTSLVFLLPSLSLLLLLLLLLLVSFTQVTWSEDKQCYQYDIKLNVQTCYSWCGKKIKQCPLRITLFNAVNHFIKD